MARFKKNNGSPLQNPLTLISTNAFPFKVSGLGPDRHHLQLKSSSPAINVVVVSANDANIEQNLKLVAQKVNTTTSVTLSTYTSNGTEDLATGCINIIIEPVLSLPDGEAGLIARMLLAENITPDNRRFVSQEQSLVSMQWMRHVFSNRLALNPASFGAKKDAKSIRDLIVAPKQVEGFQHYPTIGIKQSGNIEAILKIANDATHRDCLAYRQFVQSAIDVAQAFKLGIDPCPTGLYAWRTAGSGSPGADFVKYQSQGGQDFYTLTSDYLEKAKKK